VGSIVHGLFEEIQELADFVPNFKSNYSKHNIDLQRSVLLLKSHLSKCSRTSFWCNSMFKMAKGFKPFMTENQLALLTVAQQEITRITPQSFVGTSFVYFGTPRVIVKKTMQLSMILKLKKRMLIV
jgi:hypothetical protein